MLGPSSEILKISNAESVSGKKKKVYIHFFLTFYKLIWKAEWKRQKVIWRRKRGLPSPGSSAGACKSQGTK